MPDHHSTDSPYASAPRSDDAWRVRLGESFLRQAMLAREWLMLAGYVRALRARGVDVAPLYDRARLDKPSAPTLDELDRQVEEALAREETSVSAS